MRLALDAGPPGDTHPWEGILAGAARAAAELHYEVVLYGPSALAVVLAASREPRLVRERLSVVETDSWIGPDEDPQTACRDKPRSTAMLAFEALAQGRVEAAVSCSSARAAGAAALWQCRRLKGVLKPALAALLPGPRGRTILLDAGLNAEAKSWHLLQFALMGAAASSAVFKVPEPSVGLLGSGPLAQETSPLLKYSGLRFSGRATAEQVVRGELDVVVCDGPGGSTALELLEGMAASCFEMLESAIVSRAGARLGRAFLGGALAAARERLAVPQPSLPVLGVDGAAVACRRRDADAVFAALRLAVELAREDAKSRIQARVEDVKSSMDGMRAIE